MDRSYILNGILWVVGVLAFIAWQMYEAAISQWYKEMDPDERYRLMALADARWEKKMAKKGYVRDGGAWKKRR